MLQEILLNCFNKYFNLLNCKTVYDVHFCLVSIKLYSNGELYKVVLFVTNASISTLAFIAHERYIIPMLQRCSVLLPTYREQY